ncbi:MAG: sensor histidine kinase [Bacteroidales bacterium]
MPPKILISVSLIILATVAATLFYSVDQPMAMVGCVLVILVGIHQIIRSYRLQLQKIKILFEAVANNDYSFRFPDKGADPYERELNRTFNNMRELLSATKAEAIEKEKYYELILDRVNTGIVVIDDAGHILQTNDAALLLLGIPVLTHTRQLYQLDEAFPELFRTLSSENKRQIIFSTERGERNLTIDVTEMQVNQKKIRIIALNDIDSELDENELQSWIKLTRVLTHEIMNGISPITSLSEHLLRKETGNHKLREGLEVIHHTCTQLSSFVASYRKFTRIPTPVKQVFELREFFRMEITGMRTTTSLPIRFDLITEPADLMIYADKSLLSQIVLNLLRNAIQALASQPDPYIRITAQSDEKEQIVIHFDNNGETIPAEVSRQIFIPFFTTKEAGSGIGLSVSKQIMHQHNGSLRLSYSTDSETRFTLTFR